MSSTPCSPACEIITPLTANTPGPGRSPTRSARSCFPLKNRPHPAEAPASDRSPHARYLAGADLPAEAATATDPFPPDRPVLHTSDGWHRSPYDHSDRRFSALPGSVVQPRNLRQSRSYSRVRSLLAGRDAPRPLSRAARSERHPTRGSAVLRRWRWPVQEWTSVSPGILTRRARRTLRRR